VNNAEIMARYRAARDESIEKHRAGPATEHGLKMGCTHCKARVCEICEEDGIERPGVAEEFDPTAGYFWVCKEHKEDTA
jgi:hypothetical protein